MVMLILPLLLLLPITTTTTTTLARCTGSTSSSNTMWAISLSITNFNPIVGFSIAFYLNNFGQEGLEVVSFQDPLNFLSFVPGASTVFEGNA